MAPRGFYYFVDVGPEFCFALRSGKPHEKIRKTKGGNGLHSTSGRLINCEGDGRRVTRTELDGTVATLIDRFEGKRINRPNDVICHSNGTLLFTDPSLRVPVAEREVRTRRSIDRTRWRGEQTRGAFEYPNGLALSPDERTLYVANTAGRQYIHAIELDADWQHGAAAGFRRHVADGRTACRMG